jgi:hypothetical protein
VKSAKGLPPYCATYLTKTDHRRQVEAAEVRRAKRRDIKRRRRLDTAAVAGDEAAPIDVCLSRAWRDHTRRR